MSVIGSRAPSPSRHRRRRRRGRRSRPATTCCCRPRQAPENARGVPLGPRPPGGRAHAGGGGPANAARIRLAAEGPLVRHRAQPARAAPRHRRRRRGRDPHGRHATARPPGDAAPAARRAHHHAGVPVPDAHLACARHAERRGVGDRRRDPRRRADQARCAPGADARAARAPRRKPGAADRPVGNAAPARGGREVPHRPGARVHDRRRRHPQAARPPDPRAGRGHARAGCPRRDRPGRRRHGYGGGRGRPGGHGSRADRATRAGRRDARSGRRSTPSSSSWCGGTAPRSCS